MLRSTPPRSTPPAPLRPPATPPAALAFDHPFQGAPTGGRAEALERRPARPCEDLV